MIPYWILFLLPASVALVGVPSLSRAPDARVPLTVFGLLLALMIGFRWKVGGDWGFEAELFRRIHYLDFTEALKQADPAFALAAWMLADTGYNVWTLNLVCGGVFAAGLIIFCRREPQPWLAITVAIPYLVIVVAMGYSRQSVAIGLCMIALARLQDRSLNSFFGLMIVAAAVHTSAALIIPLGMLASRVSKLKIAVIGIPACYIAYSTLFSNKVDYFVSGYIDAGYQSDGALIRVVMNLVPALLYFAFRKRFQLTPDQQRLGTALAGIALLFMVFLAVSPSSTAVDRMALYIIPLQLFVLGRLPLALARSWFEFRLLVGLVVTYSAFVMYVWLNFATHSEGWLPYQLFPLDEMGVSP